jgi:hypothetical protein
MSQIMESADRDLYKVSALDTVTRIMPTGIMAIRSMATRILSTRIMSTKIVAVAIMAAGIIAARTSCNTCNRAMSQVILSAVIMFSIVL